MIKKFRILTSVISLAVLPNFAHAGNKVSINSDNVLVINGRKVFPIGFTMAPAPDAKAPDGRPGLQVLAEAGITFFRTGPGKPGWNDAAFEMEQKWEDAAARYGLYCWCYLQNLAYLDGKNPAREANLRRLINRFKDHPGLGLWKGEDEPEWGKKKVEPLKRVYDIVHELDPDHPLILMQAPRGTVESLRPYNVACDITGMDVYPIGYPPGTHSLLPNKELSMVGDYTKMMMEVSGRKIPVWMVLQIAWSGVLKPGKTLRFPTYAQERFMAFEAIIDGARGLNFFGGNLTNAMTPEDAQLGWNWTFWRRVLHPVIEQIGTKSPLAPALVAPGSRLPVTVTGANDVEFCVREAGDDVYILACKREGATVQVEFAGLPMSHSVGEVMYESPRKMEVKDGKFKDWFAPFDVHVYRFPKASDK